MMIDPMFMIVQNLGLFLTAVTLTIVAPTTDQYGLYWTILNYNKPNKTILNHLELFLKPF